MNIKEEASEQAVNQSLRLPEKQSRSNFASQSTLPSPPNSVNSGNGYLSVCSDDQTRIIGQIKNNTFIKSNFHSKRHLCHKYNAIGIDKGAFLQILNTTEYIEVSDKDTGVTYSIPSKEFHAHCIEDDLGWGKQLFCPLKFFEKRNRHYQLSLWGVQND